MHLPEHILHLINMLESRGYEAWAVGGCVRDSLLGITPHDFDLCSCALPEQIQAVFSDHQLVLAGLKHGTVGVVTGEGVVEITTFRTEGDYADARHPGWVRFVSSIDEDLGRRDFTVNAMAYSPARGYRDPFGGQEDLKCKILRCVGDPETRFREDALRILRGARFAARFGLTIEDATWNAMLETKQLMGTLARERVLDELGKFLLLTDAAMLCRLAPILAQAIPELEPMIGFDQRSPHHAHDVFTHTALVVQGVPPVLELRMAALLHDVAKPVCFSADENGRGHFYGHAKVGAEMANEILLRLKAPTQLREDAVWLIEHHMHFYGAERKAARRALSRHGLQRMLWLMELQEADLGGKGAEPIGETLAKIDATRQILLALDREEGQMSLRRLAVKGGDLMAAGFPAGRELGTVLNRLLDAVIGEEVPNEREALLKFAEKIRRNN